MEKEAIDRFIAYIFFGVMYIVWLYTIKIITDSIKNETYSEDKG